MAALKDSVPQACINAPPRRLSNLNLLHTSSKYSVFIVSFYTSSTSFVDMSASDLAGGSQDLAALLRLFATDGVERNALASHWYFSGDYTPIVKVASAQGWARGINVNLGNLGGEKAFNKNPILIAFALFICSGLTTWLLEVVQAE